MVAELVLAELVVLVLSQLICLALLIPIFMSALSLAI